MDQLPQEVINIIAGFIERRLPESDHDWALAFWERKPSPSNFPPYAAISRSWKHAIERMVFKKLTIRSTELERFEAVFRGDRRSILTDLTLEIVLPTYSDKARGQFERPADLVANDEAFTQAIHKLMAILKSWENPSVAGSITLRVGEIYSPSDRRSSETRQQEQLEIWSGQRHDLFDHRFKNSVIRLLRPDSLPTLGRVARLSIPRSGARRLDMRATVDIFAKFANLEGLGCDFYDNEKRYTDRRLSGRHSCASALSNYTSASAKTASLSFCHEAPRNQRVKPTNLIADHTFDPLSAAVRRFFLQCQNLTSLELDGVFDSSIFWLPPSQSDSTLAVGLPKLEVFIVTFDMTAPSGHWYFIGASNSDHEEVPVASAEDDDSDPDSPFSDEYSYDDFDAEEDERLSGATPVNIFRTVPNPALLDPLVLAFTKCIRQMPSILRSILTTGTLSGPDQFFQFEIGYYAPGQRAIYGDDGGDDQSFRRWYLEVGKWRPSEDILKEFREVGESTWGDQLIERFLDSQY